MTRRVMARPRAGDMAESRRIIKAADVVLALTIVAVAMAVAAAQAGWGIRGRDGEARARTAIVEVDNAEYARIPLPPQRGAAATTLEISTGQGRKALLEVSADGRVRMARSDCPDQVCVRTGWIAAPGKTIVCLPNRIVVRIEGETGAGADDASPAPDAVDVVAY